MPSDPCPADAGAFGQGLLHPERLASRRGARGLFFSPIQIPLHPMKYHDPPLSRDDVIAKMVDRYEWAVVRGREVFGFRAVQCKDCGLPLSKTSRATADIEAALEAHRTEHEMSTVQTCDQCGTRDDRPQDALMASGWTFGEWALCPRCAEGMFS